MEGLYRFLADAVLVLHFAIVAFIIIGQVLIVLGGFQHWRWIANPWFRFTHLISIGIVVAQAWLGRLCPLTILEEWLRQQSGDGSYQGSFVQYWLQRLLYYDFPLWTFTVAYSLFAILVVISWFRFPPDFQDKAPK